MGFMTVPTSTNYFMLLQLARHMMKYTAPTCEGVEGLRRLNASPTVVTAPSRDAATQGFSRALVSQNTGVKTNQSHCIFFISAFGYLNRYNHAHIASATPPARCF